MQVQIIADAVFVALEVGDVHRIEADKRGPQADIGFSELVACQVALLAEYFLQTVERDKYVFYGFVIGCLAGGKACFVDAVIHGVVDPAVQLVDLLTQRGG